MSWRVTEPAIPESAFAEARAIERALSQEVRPGRAEGSKAYLKIDLEFTGASVPPIAPDFFQWHVAVE